MNVNSPLMAGAWPTQHRKVRSADYRTPQATRRFLTKVLPNQCVIVKFNVSVSVYVPLVPVTTTVVCVGGGGGGGGGGGVEDPPPPQETIPSTSVIATTPNAVLDLRAKFDFRPKPASTTATAPARAPGQRKNGWWRKLAVALVEAVMVNGMRVLGLMTIDPGTLHVTPAEGEEQVSVTVPLKVEAATVPTRS